MWGIKIERIILLSLFSVLFACESSIPQQAPTPQKSLSDIQNANVSRPSARVLLDHAGLISDCAACHDGINATGKSINHILTDAPCETCHTVETWLITNTAAPVPIVSAFDHTTVVGTPCLDCHDNVVEQGKPVDHVVSSDICDECHTTDTWAIPTATPPAEPPPADPTVPAPVDPPPPEIEFDHTTVAGTPCLDCHDNVIEEGKPLNHIESSDACADCHTTETWDIVPAEVPPVDPPPPPFDHATVAGTPCLDCHDNVIEEGKPLDHIESSDACADCHTTETWDIVPADVPPVDPPPADPLPADPPPPPFDHAAVAGTPCLDCHDNVIEEGKPLDHIEASDLCGDCHTTDNWDVSPPAPPPAVAIFDHSSVIGIACIECHNNIVATGMSVTHIVTVDACDVCHESTSWIVSTIANIQGVSFDHSAVVDTPCMDCHDIIYP